MSRRVRVHQFVLTEAVRPHTPLWRASNLLGASHWVEVPADIEFPFTVPRLHVFTRFYLDRARPVDFDIRIRWLDAPGNGGRVIGNFGPFTVPFARDASVRDWSFNLHNIRLRGVGLHRVELIRPRPRGWNSGKSVRVATTYFVVER